MAQSQSTTSTLPPSPLTTVLNFRDVSQTINTLLPRPLLSPHLLYRSARPDSASPQDRLSLTTTYALKTILDLRSKTEHVEQDRKRDAQKASLGPDIDVAATNEPIKIPGVDYVEINLNGGSFSRALLWRLSWGSIAKLLSLMATGYRIEAIAILGREVMAPRGLVGLGKDSLDFSKGEIQACFEILADAERYPVLVHCTQGKDRTGLVVFLVLLLCGVPVEAIDADYTVSERELEVEREGRMKEIRSIGLGEEFAGCPEGFVMEMKEYLDERYGGLENYLEGCGVDSRMQERIRRKLVT